MEEAGRCYPPLSDDEPGKVWASAQRFAKKVQGQPGYVPPEKYQPDTTLQPSDYSDVERKQYERLKSELVMTVSDREITVPDAAALTGKLSQLANGAIYDDAKHIVEFHSRKLDALEDIIESVNGNPLLVAYWFRHDIERIRKRFEVREIRTSQDIIDWNAEKIPVAMIHPASAGHGLNLQSGGSILVWFGLTWSLKLYITKRINT